MATLEVFTESGGRQLHELIVDETIVGRDTFCDIVLREHTVSRQHARIVRTAEGFYVEDLSSLNGTYLNGRRVEGRALVQDQDRIHIYEVAATFHVSSPKELEAEATTRAGSLASQPLPDETTSRERSAGRKLHATRASDAVEVDHGSQARFRAALKISLDLEGGHDIDELLPKILDSLFETFPQAERGYILLAEGPDAYLVPRAIKHRQNESGQSMTFGPISRQTALQVMSSGQAVLIDDGPSAAEAQHSVLDVRCLSVICAPLTGPSRRPMGIIYLDATDPKRRYTQDDLDVLVAVSTIAGQQVEAATARQTHWDSPARQQHLGAAKQVQLQFLPQRRPQVGGYEFYDYYQSAGEVGGDYFGYIPLADGRLALAIGDVAGKGVSAALLMAHFCAEVRYCLATSATPSQAVDQLNQDLSAEMLNYHFVTFSLCVLDPLEHRVTLVNAGHLPPLRRRNGAIEELGAAEGGLPLGCDTQRHYQQIEVPLEPGDAIVLYTDGISEAMNAQGEVYGARRIREVLSRAPHAVDAMGQALLDDVRRFVRGRLQSDDICLVCYARTD